MVTIRENNSGPSTLPQEQQKELLPQSVPLKGEPSTTKSPPQFVDALPLSNLISSAVNWARTGLQKTAQLFSHSTPPPDPFDRTVLESQIQQSLSPYQNQSFEPSSREGLIQATLTILRDDLQHCPDTNIPELRQRFDGIIKLSIAWEELITLKKALPTIFDQSDNDRLDILNTQIKAAFTQGDWQSLATLEAQSTRIQNDVQTILKFEGARKILVAQSDPLVAQGRVPLLWEFTAQSPILTAAYDGGTTTFDLRQLNQSALVQAYQLIKITSPAEAQAIAQAIEFLKSGQMNDMLLDAKTSEAVRGTALAHLQILNAFITTIGTTQVSTLKRLDSDLQKLSSQKMPAPEERSQLAAIFLDDLDGLQARFKSLYPHCRDQDFASLVSAGLYGDPSEGPIDETASLDEFFARVAGVAPLKIARMGAQQRTAAYNLNDETIDSSNERQARSDTSALDYQRQQLQRLRDGDLSDDEAKEVLTNAAQFLKENQQTALAMDIAARHVTSGGHASTEMARQIRAIQTAQSLAEISKLLGGDEPTAESVAQANQNLTKQITSFKEGMEEMRSQFVVGEKMLFADRFYLSVAGVDAVIAEANDLLETLQQNPDVAVLDKVQQRLTHLLNSPAAQNTHMRSEGLQQFAFWRDVYYAANITAPVGALGALAGEYLAATALAGTILENTTTALWAIRGASGLGATLAGTAQSQLMASAMGNLSPLTDNAAHNIWHIAVESALATVTYGVLHKFNAKFIDPWLAKQTTAKGIIAAGRQAVAALTVRSAGMYVATTPWDFASHIVRMAAMEHRVDFTEAARRSFGFDALIMRIASLPAFDLYGMLTSRVGQMAQQRQSAKTSATTGEQHPAYTWGQAIHDNPVTGTLIKGAVEIYNTVEFVANVLTGRGPFDGGLSFETGAAHLMTGLPKSNAMGAEKGANRLGQQWMAMGDKGGGEGILRRLLSLVQRAKQPTPPSVEKPPTPSKAAEPTVRAPEAKPRSDHTARAQNATTVKTPVVISAESRQLLLTPGSKFIIGRASSESTPNLALEERHFSRQEIVIETHAEGHVLKRNNSATTLIVINKNSGEIFHLKGKKEILLPPGEYTFDISGEALSITQKIPFVRNAGAEPTQINGYTVGNEQSSWHAFDLTIPQMPLSIDGATLDPTINRLYFDSTATSHASDTIFSQSAAAFDGLNIQQQGEKWLFHNAGSNKLIIMNRGSGSRFELTPSSSEPNQPSQYSLPQIPFSPGVYTIQSGDTTMTLVVPRFGPQAHDPKARAIGIRTLADTDVAPVGAIPDPIHLPPAVADQSAPTETPPRIFQDIELDKAARDPGFDAENELTWRMQMLRDRPSDQSIVRRDSEAIAELVAHINEQTKSTGMDSTGPLNAMNIVKGLGFNFDSRGNLVRTEPNVSFYPERQPPERLPFKIVGKPHRLHIEPATENQKLGPPGIGVINSISEDGQSFKVRYKNLKGWFEVVEFEKGEQSIPAVGSLVQVAPTFGGGAGVTKAEQLRNNLQRFVAQSVQDDGLSTLTNDGTLAPRLAGEGELAYTPENPPTDPRHFDYGPIMPRLFDQGDPHIFGAKRDSDSGLEKAWTHFRDMAQQGTPVKPIYYSEGRLSPDGFIMPMAAYAIPSSAGDTYLLVQGGIHYIVEAASVRDGTLTLYRGLKDSTEFDYPDFTFASDSPLSKLQQEQVDILYQGFYAFTFASSERSFNFAFNATTVGQGSADHVGSMPNPSKDYAKWLIRQDLDPMVLRELISRLSSMRSQHFTKNPAIAQGKFGPHYVEFKVPLDNIVLGPSLAGEGEVYIVDPRRVEVTRAEGLKINSLPPQEMTYQNAPLIRPFLTAEIATKEISAPARQLMRDSLEHPSVQQLLAEKAPEVISFLTLNKGVRGETMLEWLANGRGAEGVVEFLEGTTPQERNDILEVLRGHYELFSIYNPEYLKPLLKAYINRANTEIDPNQTIPEYALSWPIDPPMDFFYQEADIATSTNKSTSKITDAETAGKLQLLPEDLKALHSNILDEPRTGDQFNLDLGQGKQWYRVVTTERNQVTLQDQNNQQTIITNHDLGQKHGDLQTDIAASPERQTHFENNFFHSLIDYSIACQKYVDTAGSIPLDMSEANMQSLSTQAQKQIERRLVPPNRNGDRTNNISTPPKPTSGDGSVTPVTAEYSAANTAPPQSRAALTPTHLAQAVHLAWLKGAALVSAQLKIADKFFAQLIGGNPFDASFAMERGAQTVFGMGAENPMGHDALGSQGMAMGDKGKGPNGNGWGGILRGVTKFFSNTKPEAPSASPSKPIPSPKGGIADSLVWPIQDGIIAKSLTSKDRESLTTGRVSSVAQSILNNPSTAPHTVVEIEGRRFYISQRLQDNDNRQYYTVLYGTTEGIEACFFYGSKSGGNWRFSTYSLRGVIDKGSVNYTQGNKITEGLLPYLLAHQEGSFVPVEKGFVPDMFNLGKMGMHSAMIAIADKVASHDSSELAGLQRFQQGSLFKHVDDGEHVPPTLKQFNDITAQLPREFIPDTMNTRPEDRGPGSHPELGSYRTYRFRSTLDGREVYWDWSVVDRDGYGFLSGCNFTDVRVNRFGGSDVALDIGFLAAKPLEYRSQMGVILHNPQHEFHPYLRKSSDPSYVDQRGVFALLDFYQYFYASPFISYPHGNPGLRGSGPEPVMTPPGAPIQRQTSPQPVRSPHQLPEIKPTERLRLLLVDFISNPNADKQNPPAEFREALYDICREIRASNDRKAIGKMINRLQGAGIQEPRTTPPLATQARPDLVANPALAREIGLPFATHDLGRITEQERAAFFKGSRWTEAARQSDFDVEHILTNMIYAIARTNIEKVSSEQTREINLLIDFYALESEHSGIPHGREDALDIVAEAGYHFDRSGQLVKSDPTLIALPTLEPLHRVKPATRLAVPDTLARQLPIIDPHTPERPQDRIGLVPNTPKKPREVFFTEKTVGKGTIALGTHPGKGGKTHNEDAFVQGTFLNPNTNQPEYWFVVLDGLSGHGHGDKAAEDLGRFIHREMKVLGDFVPSFKAAERSLEVQDYFIESVGAPPAAVAAGVHITTNAHGERIAKIAHVGDAAVWILRKQNDGQYELIYETKDQSYDTDFSEKSNLEKRADPKGHMVANALGLKRGAPTVSPDIVLKPGDLILSLTDGYTDNLSPDEVIAIVNKSKSPQEIHDKMQEAALTKMEIFKEATADLAVIKSRIRQQARSISDETTLRPLQDLDHFGYEGCFVNKQGEIFGPDAQPILLLTKLDQSNRYMDPRGNVYEGQLVDIRGPNRMNFLVDHYKPDNLTAGIYQEP